jgi:type II secretory pathway pseudopilin PulG
MRRPRRAAALITTLLVIVVLSIIVVAFLQSMSIDRLTANSARSMLQAELAARAGLNSAIAQILIATGTNNAFVTGSTNYAAGHGPLVVIGQSNLVDAMQLMPLVSMPPEILGDFLQPDWTSSLHRVFSDLTGSNSTDVNGRSRIIQSTTNNKLYRAPWVVISSSSGERIGRFAYLVLDENARVNPLAHTGSGTMANPTNWYGGPADISLTNAAAQILTPAEQTAILAASNRFLTPDSLAQAFATKTDFDRVKHLLTLQTNETYDVIPANLEDGGRPKYNINELATNYSQDTNAELRANRIAEIISSNLTSFGGRDPSLRGVAANEMQYLRRLAAGVVDFVDPDSAPTLVNGGEPAGRDLFPLVAAVAERFRRTSIDTNAASTTIESQCFVQVWNPYTTEIAVSNQALRFVIRNRMKVAFGTGLVTPFDDYDQTISVNAVIRPNEFVVFEFPTTSQTWTSPGPVNDVPKWDDGPSGNADESTHCPFEFYIDGKLVDMNRRPPVGSDVAISGMVRFGLAFSDATNRWQCSFIPTQNSPSNWRFVGDSRGSYLCNYDWQTLGTSGYTSGTLWKGRQQNTLPRYQEFTAHWVQRDYVRDNPSMGSLPASINQTPSQVAQAYSDPNDATAAPAILGNRAMRSVGELGHIFDPAQAADDLSAPISSDPPFNNKISGGGRTLRIGQPEFRSATLDSWDTNGRRAIELLDLFTVNSTNSSSEGFPAAIGRINPNTAAPEVLAAVLSGIQVTSDKGIPGSSLKETAALAANIVSNRPYSALSDLHKVAADFATGANYAPTFTTSVGGGTTNLAAVDRVREEAFGKLVQHLTVQSRTYRVIAVGEAFDPVGKARGHATLEAIVFLQNKPGGGVDPVITFQRSF